MKRIHYIFLLCALLLTLAGCGTQQSGQVSYIGAEEAKTLALEAADLTAQQVEFSGTDMSTRSGMDYYQVAFTADGQSYQYDIDALTGTVIDSKTPDIAQTPNTEQPDAADQTTHAPEGSLVIGADTYSSPVPTDSTSRPADMLTEDAVKEAALTHAGIAADEVTFVKAGLDWDDGREYYDVEFYTADHREFDYDIDPYTGAVLSYDHDAEYYTPPANNTGKEITADEAKAIALAQVPGATVNDIREFEVDYDDGRVEYEGTIYYDRMEYEFEIDGFSGAIRSWEVESIYD